MSNLVKSNTIIDSDQVLENVYNDSDKTISTSAFITSKLGNKIVRTLASATVETYAFYDGSNLLYTLTVTYTDSTLGTISQVERTA